MFEKKTRNNIKKFRAKWRKFDRIMIIFWIELVIFNFVIGYITGSTLSYSIGAFILGGVIVMMLNNNIKKYNYAMEDLWMNAYFDTYNNYHKLANIHMEVIGKWNGKKKPKNKSKNTIKKKKK